MAAASIRSAAIALAAALVGAMPASADEPVPIDQEPRHRLVFSNAHVRFFDVFLPPGYRSLMHVHHHDGVFVNIAPSETLAEDWGQPGVLRPGRTPGESYFVGYATRPKAHRVSNVGQSHYHVTDTEILRGCGTPRHAADKPVGPPVIVDNDRVRVTRLELAPGDSATLHGPCGMLVSVTPATLILDAPGGRERLELEPAGFKWRQSDQSMSLTNAGTEASLIVDILVK
jgi:quercetin dioxygenase-like cupin family protein